MSASLGWAVFCEACQLVACWAGQGLCGGQDARALEGLPEHIVAPHARLDVIHVCSVPLPGQAGCICRSYVPLHQTCVVRRYALKNTAMGRAEAALEAAARHVYESHCPAQKL